MAKLGPLESETDRQYVIRKEAEFRLVFTNKLREDESEAGRCGRRIRPTDRFRFVLAFSDETVYAEYIKSQECLSRPEIDAGVSGAGAAFWDVFLEKVNDFDWEPQTRSLPTLHSNFREPITCSRGEYEWTLENGKKHLNELRRNLSEMIRRYEISGNGANQALHDDSENEIDEDEDKRGSFNSERAKRSAARRNETGSGDDRASYLRHLPADYLYAWDELDMLGLLHFTCARLSDRQSASSHATPSPTTSNC